MNTDNEKSALHGDILAVDDNISNLKTLTDILTVTGYQTRSATDGESALHSIQEKQPELILLDYKMTGMNGIDLCQLLKEEPKTRDIPIIFISAHGDTDLQVKALGAGAIDYILKPINPPEVLARIASHLTNYRLKQKLAVQSENLLKEIEVRSQVEDKLRQSLKREQELADIVRKAPLAIAYGYPDGRLASCNSAFSELTGYSLEELQTINWNHTLTPAKWQEIEAEKLGQLSTSNRSIRYEKEYIRKNGKIVPIELVVTAKYDTDHNLIHYIAFISDITQKKKMEKQLFLNEKMATIAGLAAGVAHEINTPLSAILQAHQLVEMGLSPEEEMSVEKANTFNVNLTAVQEYLKNSDLDYFMNGIRESALKASQIINSLLEFSRPQEGHFSTIHPQELLKNALLLSQADYNLKKTYGITGIQFVEEYAPDCPSIICVAAEIEQVLLNLIKNSAQALATANHHQKPCITLRLSSRDNEAVIEVEDNGPGISEDVKKHIFDPFFTTREVGTGTGLGLSVSHTIIVDKHNGSIRFESEPGKGTRCIVELPLNRDL